MYKFIISFFTTLAFSIGDAFVDMNFPAFRETDKDVLSLQASAPFVGSREGTASRLRDSVAAPTGKYVQP
ncbi:MAG TPA: hypothetical protein VK017_11930 [Sphingobacterium sp.]|jgi:hypothetical protein|nr:hypothetical protein [Sphingobacterium sp.]